MASQPKPVVEDAGEVLLLPVDEIDPAPAKRIGLFWPEKAEGLAARIAADGQNDPIKVRINGNRAATRWTLVAGLHRLEGCRLAGLRVKAIEVSGDDEELRALQASENVDRRELEPLERAMFVAAVADAARRRAFDLAGVDSDKALAGKASRAGDKMSPAESGVQFRDDERADAEAQAASDALTDVYRWNERAAAACGLGPRDLQRSLRIYRIIVEPNRDLIDAFKSHPVATNASALLAICAKGTNALANVRAVIEWLIANPEARAADEALVALGLMQTRGNTDQARGDDKFINGVTSNLARLSAGGQRRAVELIVEVLNPSALRSMHDLLSARIADIGEQA